ncbi:MAG TPA: hypothetical protein VKV69_03240 [Actinomycetota bacterium]|nr:hypothetical protein [Actinomycetota bacterium]
MRHPKQRRMLRRMFSAWVALSTLGVGMMVLATGARAATVYDVVNMTVNASSIHVIGNSNAFPNFRTGAIDNSYAYAHAHVDGSPFAQGRSSPLDTGPFVQLQAATNPVKPFAQPQYADVRFPPTATQPQEFCFTQLIPFLATMAGAPQQTVGPCQRAVGYAQAFARENYAFAQANEAGDTGEQPAVASSPAPSPPLPPIGGAPSTGGKSSTTTKPTVLKTLPVAFTYKPLSPQLVALNAALLAWRARWLTADDAARFPAHMAATSTPDGADGMSAISETTFDPATGVLTLRGDSRVARVSLGSGAIVLHGVHTIITMIDDGSGPKSTMSMSVASAEVGGVPVSIGPDGVSVNGTQVPGVGDAIQQASAQLNTALAQSGWSIVAAKPNIVQSAGQKTIDASAVLVTFAPAAPAPGVPTIYTYYWVGQVFADQLGTVGIPLGSGSGGGSFIPGTNGTPGSTQFIPGTNGTPGSSGSVGQGGTNVGGLQRLLKTKPLYLLLLYFLWQVVIIGTGASLWWLRMGGKPA